MIKINKKNTENKCGAIINRLEHKKHQYCRGRTLGDPQNAITLISLVITIAVLVILSAAAIYLTLGNNGILNKAEQAKNETIKQTATEKMNLKITNMQIEKYAEEQRMPTLQEFADGLCEDDEIQYVQLQSKKVGSLSKIEVGEAESIFTKLKEYPYEFEINSSLQLASIDGIKVADNNDAEINNKLSWKLLGTTTGTNVLNLPSSFNELYIETGVANLNMIIPAITLQSTEKEFIMSCVYEKNVKSAHKAVVTVSNTKINLKYYRVLNTDGSLVTNGDYTSNTEISIYYR